MADIPRRSEDEPSEGDPQSREMPPEEEQSEEDLPERFWERTRKAPSPSGDDRAEVTPYPTEPESPPPHEATRREPVQRWKPPDETTQVGPRREYRREAPTDETKREKPPESRAEEYWVRPRTPSSAAAIAAEALPETYRPLTRARAEAAILPTILCLLEIALAELITGLSKNVLGGFVLYALIIFTFMVQSAIAHPNPRYKFYLALSLVPLIRVLYALPLHDFTGGNIYPAYIIVAVPLLATAFVAIRTLKYDRSDVYLVAGNIPLQILLPITGVVFGIAMYLAAQPESLIEDFSLVRAIMPAIVLLLATGVTLELIFRGILQRAAVDAFGNRGLFLVAGAFAAIHVADLSLGIVVAFVMGLFFAWAVKQTGSLWGVMLAGGIANITALLIAPHYLG